MCVCAEEVCCHTCEFVLLSWVWVQPVLKDTSMNAGFQHPEGWRFFAVALTLCFSSLLSFLGSSELICVAVKSNLTDPFHCRCPFAAILARLRKIRTTSDLGNSPEQSHDRPTEMPLYGCVVYQPRVLRMASQSHPGVSGWLCLHKMVKRRECFQEDGLPPPGLHRSHQSRGAYLSNLTLSSPRSCRRSGTG